MFGRHALEANEGTSKVWGSSHVFSGNMCRSRHMRFLPPSGRYRLGPDCCRRYEKTKESSKSIIFDVSIGIRLLPTGRKNDRVINIYNFDVSSIFALCPSYSVLVYSDVILMGVDRGMQNLSPIRCDYSPCAAICFDEIRRRRKSSWGWSS